MSCEHCGCEHCEVGPRRRRSFSYANVMSTLAVFLVIAGGTAIAATAARDSVNSKSVKNNSLKGKDVKDSSLKSQDVRDESLTAADVDIDALPPTGPAGGALAGSYPNPTVAAGAISGPQVLDDSLGAADLAADAVGAAELADDAVGSGEVQADSLLAADLGPNSVGGSEITGGAVSSGEVANGSLSTADVGRVAGSFALDFGSVGANDCLGANVNLAGFGAFDSNDPVFVMPDTAWGGAISLNVEGTGTTSTIALKACNPTGAPINPDGAGGSYRFIAFNAP